MAITKEQLKKLQDIKSAAVADRQSQNGDSWDKIRSYVLPELESSKKRKRFYSTAAQQYTSLATNALQGWAYGRSISWMHLCREDQSVKGRGEEKDGAEWFQACERLMMEDLSRSAFYDEAQAFTKVVLNMSTGIMLLDWDEESSMPIYENLNPEKCAILQDKNHSVDVLFYEFQMDKDTAERAFDDDCPEKIKKSNSYSDKWKFTKAIMPAGRFDLDVEGNGSWIEIVWFEDDRNRTITERTMDYKPFVCWRFERSLTGSPWGVNSPGERCIADIIALNVLEKSKLKGIQLRNDPPIKATEGLELNLVPSGITYLDGNKDFQYAPLPGSSEEILVEIQRYEQRLKEAYYVDFFLVLQQTMENQKTATEASLLADEKSQIMSSFTSRLNNEFLEPVLETLFAMEMDHLRLPPAPEDLQGKDLKIDYVSPLTIAQRKAQIYAPARQFMAETLAFAEVDPNVRYIFKVPEYAENMSRDLMIDQRFIREAEEVEEMAERDQQMAMSQMAADSQQKQAAAEANAYNALSKAPEQGSPMQSMMGGMR